MMKFSNILVEGEEKKVKLTPIEKKMLSIMEKKGVETSMKDVLHFLVKVLSITNPYMLTQLIKLYINNKDKGDQKFSEMESAILDKKSPKNKNIEALSKFLDIDPFFIEEIDAGDPTGVYLPQYEAFIIDDNPSQFHTSHTQEYLVSNSEQQSYDAASTIIEDDYNNEGLNAFNSSWVVDEVNWLYWWIEEQAEYRADDDMGRMSPFTMRDQLGLQEDYEDIEEEMEFLKKEIVVTLREIQELEFQRDNIEKEKIILEKEIEKLSGHIEYEDEAYGYEEFGEEVERLEIKLNEAERFFMEIQTMIEMTYKEKNKLSDELKEYKIQKKSYEGDELQTQYWELRKEIWLTDIEDDPFLYLEDYLGYDLDDAIEYGYADVNVSSLIDNAISYDGVPHFLATYNGIEDEVEYEDKKYYFYQI